MPPRERDNWRLKPRREHIDEAVVHMREIPCFPEIASRTISSLNTRDDFIRHIHSITFLQSILYPNNYYGKFNYLFRKKSLKMSRSHHQWKQEVVAEVLSSSQVPQAAAFSDRKYRDRPTSRAAKIGFIRWSVASHPPNTCRGRFLIILSGAVRGLMLHSVGVYAELLMPTVLVMEVHEDTLDQIRERLESYLKPGTSGNDNSNWPPAAQ